MRNLAELFERSCARHATRPLYLRDRNGRREVGGDAWLRYEEVHALVAACRSGLASLGVGPGDRVVLIARNRVEWAVTAYATYGLGAVLVPLFRSQLAQEWAFAQDACRPKVVVVEHTVLDALSRSHDLAATRRIVLDAPETDESSFAALLARGARAPLAARDPAPDDVATIAYTSGTGAWPKGVVLSHRNLLASLEAMAQVFPLQPDDRAVSLIPWAHSYGQLCELHGMISMGASVAFASEGVEPLEADLEQLLDQIEPVAPTILFAVPSIFHRLHTAVRDEVAARADVVQRVIEAGVRATIDKARGRHVGPIRALEAFLDDKLVFARVRARFGGRLKYAVCAGATLGWDVAELIDAMGITLYEGYGLTETSALVTVNAPGARRLGSVGRPVPGVEVTIDPRTREVLVRGDNVMRGYLRDGEIVTTDATDGALRTGDLGYFDDEGYLWLLGRMREQLRLADGSVVMPADVEEELRLSPYITNVMLYGSGRPFTIAIVVPDISAVRMWARLEGINVDDPEADATVCDLLRREVLRLSQGFPLPHRPRDVVVAPHDFTVENGLLTPMQKVRRGSVAERWHHEIEEVYAAARREPLPSSGEGPKTAAE